MSSRAATAPFPKRRKGVCRRLWTGRGKGDAAAVDNEVSFDVGDDMVFTGGGCGGECCNKEDRCYCAKDYLACKADPHYDDLREVYTCSDHLPVFATLSMKSTRFIVDDHITGFNAEYSGEAGETPSFDMKFEWEEYPSGDRRLLGESRFGDVPIDVVNVEPFTDGIETMAARFGGNGHVRFAERGQLEAVRRVTIEVWVYPMVLAEGQVDTVVEKGAEGQVDYMLSLKGDPENAGYADVIFSTQAQCGTDWLLVEGDGGLDGPVRAWMWNHILASYDGLHLKIIVTRVDEPGQATILKSEEQYMGIPLCPNDHPLVIGARYVDLGYYERYNGVMDDLQIYSEVAR
jgi:hypothetical protein